MEQRHDSFATGDSPAITVECDRGSITIRVGPASTVDVRADLRRPEHIDYRVHSDASGVRVTAKVERGKSIFGSLVSWPGDGPRSDILVTVPATAVVQLRASNATVDVTGVQRSVTARSSNGHVNVTSCGGSIELSTSNGAVELTGCSGRLQVRSTNGRILGRSLEGTFELETTNGGIDVELQLAHGSRNSARSTNGTVRLKLAGDDIEVTGSTTNGRRNIHVPSAGRSPAARVDVRTTNGSVDVSAAHEPVTMRF
jgi:hypothetical protein